MAMSTKEEIKEAMVLGINRFLFYAWNFDSTVVRINQGGKEVIESVPRVVAEAKWNCTVEHMIDKWNKATQCGNCDSYFPRFYAELSSDNRRAFLEWIVENYSGEQNV